jgi:Zn-finger nucleic acid-binding protein
MHGSRFQSETLNQCFSCGGVWLAEGMDGCLLGDVLVIDVREIRRRRCCSRVILAKLGY